VSGHCAGGLLLGFRDGRLDAREQRRVELHLGACARCRERYRQLERGAELAARLGPVAPPASTVARIEAALRSAKPAVRSRLRWRPLLAAAAAAALIVLVGLRLRAPSVTIEPAAGSPGSLEQIALAAYGDGGATRSLDLATGSAAEVRAWLRERGLSAALVAEHPQPDREAFRLQGVSDLSRPGLDAAAVRYLIDGEPAVLVTARQDQVPDAPAWGLFGKRVHARTAPGGAHLLTWSNSGKAYTLISKLPRRGERACLVCHADQRRRRLIESLAGS
jgi:anti-sigma factor RsiW